MAAALEELKVEYDTAQHSFQLVEIAGGWRLVSRAEYAPWLKKLLDEARPHRLSPPSLETLSIIALRQPISRADIAAIRGVEVDGVIKTLLERDLITIVGRSDVPGRPLLVRHDAAVPGTFRIAQPRRHAEGGRVASAGRRVEDGGRKGGKDAGRDACATRESE